jgi:hypothetical protein
MKTWGRVDQLSYLSSGVVEDSITKDSITKGNVELRRVIHKT